MRGSVTVSAPAKLNLTLDVLGMREDGYHEMRMVMQSVSLCDTITLTAEPGEGDVRLSADLGFLPVDGKNLAVSAAQELRDATGCDWGRLTIDLRKRIPVCAGTAGGSSDAAAVLRGLNELLSLGLTPLQLAEIGARVGSDVPYCVLGGTALCSGRGERVEPLPSLPPCWVVMAKPPFPISTPELFSRVDARRGRCHPDTEGVVKALADGDLSGVARRMYNVFEEVLPPRQAKAVEELKRALLTYGALGACMSGTGPTVFGLFDREETAQETYGEMKALAPDVFLIETV